VWEYEPSINRTDRFGRTPLHLATCVNNETAIGFLLEKGFP